jgi:PAS domain S-box-containing protein
MTLRPLPAYAASIAALAGAVLLRWLLDPLMGNTLPLVTLFGAVAAAVWLGGHGPAVLNVVLGYFACAYLFIEPRGSLGIGQAVNQIGLLAYLLTCGIIIGFGVALRSAQRRAELRRDELDAILSSIGDAVIATDIEGRITNLNVVAEQLTGWSRDGALGQPLERVFRVIDEETRQPVDNPVQKILRLGRVIGLANHTVLIAKDGSERQIDDSASPVRKDGRTVGCVLVFRDVTALRSMERLSAERAAAARFLSSVVESSEDAIISKSLDGIVQSWNAAATRLFGYTAEQAVGRSITLIIPEDRRHEEEQILSRLKSGERIDHFDTLRVRSDGRPVHVSLTISPIRDEAGRITGASKIARDIGQRKEIEAALREANSRKDQFLAILAHELRNPLAPISNAVQVLLQAGHDKKTVDMMTGMLQRQVGQLSRLVDDLLDASRVAQGRIELRKERIELAAVVSRAVEAARHLIECKAHQLELGAPPQPIYIHADPVRLGQVIGNLINNACKFMDRGGLITISLESQGQEAVLRVRDKGIGIAPDQRDRIFDMFIQIDTSLERTTTGLGIGLTLVKRLVELHGGTVEVHSAGLGQGCEFVVRLPIGHETPADLAGPSPGEPVPKTRRRILIVDDNHDSAASLAMLLELDGHETKTAYDGLEAIEVAGSFHPDVTLLDIGLPTLNGYEVCRRLRQHPWGRDMLLVAVTGLGQEQDRQAAREAGFDAHLVKPVSPETLARLLASEQPPADAAEAGHRE